MEIIPFISIGDVRFGVSREAARTLLGTPQPFEKVPGEPPVDAYDKLGLHLHFSREDTLEFVEAFCPADVELLGIRLLSRPMDEVIDDLTRAGMPIERDDVGIECRDYGFGLTSRPDGVVEGVAAFTRNYYGNTNE